MSTRVIKENVRADITIRPVTQKSRAIKENLTGYAFISPFIIGFLAFTLIPILASLYLSFTNYNLFAPPKWIGFDNYIKMFTADPRYWQSLKVTLIYVAAGVPLRLAFALLI